MGNININKLNPHPKNGFYFTDVVGEKYEEIKRSILKDGIRDPIKVTAAYTIISGHQRYRIASDLGFKEVPVEIVDINEWEAEYMLLAENTERRGEAESDPIKKGRIALFMKEYWGIVHGGSRGQNAACKTTMDIANMINEDERTTRRLLKLNDLIPDIQSLVSLGKLGTTAAEQLAYLTVEEQKALFDLKGENISELSVEEVKRLRSETEKLREENDNLKSEVASLKAKPPQVVTREVTPSHIQDQISRLTKQLESKNKELREIEQERDRYINQTRTLEEKLDANEKEFGHLSGESNLFLKKKPIIEDVALSLIDSLKVFIESPPHDLPPVYKLDYIVILEKVLSEVKKAHDAVNINIVQTNRTIIDADYTVE